MMHADARMARQGACGRANTVVCLLFCLACLACPATARQLHRALRSEPVAAGAAPAPSSAHDDLVAAGGPADAHGSHPPARPTVDLAAEILVANSSATALLAEGAAAADVTGVPAPAYVYEGCYVDWINNFRGERRMRYRLAIIDGRQFTVTECARRAAMFGYTLFGVTDYEDRPDWWAFACWGAGDAGHEDTDLAFAKAYGPSTKCWQQCVTTDDSKATACGGPWALSLYRITDADQAPALAGGKFTRLAELPILAAHTVQLTSRDEFLIVDFYNQYQAHPDFDKDPTYNAIFMARDGTWRKTPFYNDEWKSIACGVFVRLTDGEIVGFGGHGQVTYKGRTSAQNHRGLYMMWKYQEVVEHLKPLPWGRWYLSATLQPDGRAYITGGADVGGRAEGSDIFDPSSMWVINQTPGIDNPQGSAPLNPALMQGVLYGGSYYPVLNYLPDGSLMYAQNILIQTLNPVTGLAIQQTQPMPYQVATMYPFAVPIIVTEHTQYWPGTDFVINIIMFGGSWWADSTNYIPCKDTSLRVMFVINAKGQHWFSQWTVETMPGPRCQSDGVLLPNNKILIFNGGEAQYPGLAPYTSQNDYFINEPWLYDPSQPYGRRYQRTGATTNQHRGYHGTALLTSKGDVLIGGSSVSNDFRWYSRGGMDWTKNGATGNHVVELFTPADIMGKRPVVVSAPLALQYGSYIDVPVRLFGLPGPTNVILVTTGCSTHSMNVQSRHVQLWNYAVGWDGDVTRLRVWAPKDTFVGLPGFHLLFVVAGNGAYSEGFWIHLRGAWNAVPLTLRSTGSKVVPAATNNFDTNAWTCGPLYATCLATAWVDPDAAAVTGKKGMRVRATGPAGQAPRTMFLLSDVFNVAAGDRVHVHFWARMTDDNGVRADVTLSLVDDDGNDVPQAYGPTRSPTLTATMRRAWEYYPLGGIVSTGAGPRRVKLSFSGCQFNTGVDMEDVVTTLVPTWAQPAPTVSAEGIAPDPGAAAVESAAEGEDGNATAAAPETLWPGYFGDSGATPKGAPRPLATGLADLAKGWPMNNPHQHHGDTGIVE